MKVKDHEGKVFPGVEAMCACWGVRYETYYHRRKAGWSMADALMMCPYERYKRNAKCEDHLGQQFSSITEMCYSYGIDLSTFLTRLRRGWSREKALTAPITGSGRALITLGSGRTFQSVAEFSRTFSLPSKRVMRLQQKRYSFDEILEIEAARKRRKKGDISGICEVQ